MIDEDQVLDYFRTRPNYTVETRQARYGNKDTGVYFLFEMHEGEPKSPDSSYSVAFNLNFFRPSYFVHEAEREVTACVRHFSWVVLDPQIHGMGEGEYQSDKLISGWNHGNEFAYRAILEKPESRKNLLTLPTDRLDAIWRWNYDRSKLQEEVGDTKFVPRISLVLVEGRLSTTIVWTDGIPMVFPPIDYVIVYRQELAPRRLLKRTPDFALLSWRDTLALLEPYMLKYSGRAFSLNYTRAPEKVSAAVRSLEAMTLRPEFVAMDAVLDSELVEKTLRTR